MSLQPELIAEDPGFLSKQLITYIGNKRALLDFIGNGLEIVRNRLGRDRIDTFDVFSGSGIVSRYLKQFSNRLFVNDLEKYSEVINKCYLTNREEFNYSEFDDIYGSITESLENGPLSPGFIAELYSPDDDQNIKSAERVFYTSRNAAYLDTARKLIETVPAEYKNYLLAPLLSEASIHANTSGVFKGFYKNSETGLGQFGGKKGDALNRILGNINLPYPVFSRFSCESNVLRGDANIVCRNIPEVDAAYLDPPYNQHPYGSNYFMLNLLTDYKRPHSISKVSGIPDNWNRSNYNKNQAAYDSFSELVDNLNAKFILVSFNSEGFISLKQMTGLLKKYGKLTVLETKYNTFRGSRNLAAREIHVKEYLYLLEKF